MDEFEKNTDTDMQNPETENVMPDGAQSKTHSRKTKKKRKLKTFAKLGLIFLLICGALFVYNFMGCNKQTAESIYTFESDSNYQIQAYDGKVLALSYDGAKIINPDGNTVANMEYHMSNPHMSVSGDMILLYDKDGRKITVYDGENKKYTFDSERKIKSAKVNRAGYAVIISDEVGYNYKVLVINSDGKIEFEWKISDEYLLDADISPNNEKLVAATITTSTGQIEQNIVMVDIKKAEEIGRSTTVGIMPLRVKFADNGDAVVLSDDRICGYNIKAEKSWEESFDNSLLDHFTMDEEGNTVVALRGIKNNTIVRAYTKNGRNSGEYITKTKANYVDLNSKYIAVCEDGKISLVNYSGRVVSEIEVKKAVKDIAIIKNDKAVILCEDSIQLCSL